MDEEKKISTGADKRERWENGINRKVCSIRNGKEFGRRQQLNVPLLSKLRWRIKVQENKKIEWIDKGPKFLELGIRNPLENLAHGECVNAPIVETLDILLKAVSDRFLSKHLKKF